MTLRHLSYAIIAGVALANRAAAQPLTPSATLRAYFDAIARERWADAAGYMRLDDFEDLRRDALANFRPAQMMQRTAADFMRDDSTMTLAVAQWHADRYKTAVDRMPANDYLSFEFADVKDTAQLTRLTPAELAARWIQARDNRYKMNRMLASSPDCPRELYSAAAASFVPRMDILGEVVRADTAWVLYREIDHQGEVPDRFQLPPVITTFRRQAGVWQVRPRESFSRGFSVGFIKCVDMKK